MTDIVEAQARQRLATDPMEAEYWAGRLAGARRSQHGEDFDPELHGKRLAAIWSPDESRRAYGRGYREALGISADRMPPHPDEIREVCARIGSGAQIAARLRLGNGGGRQVRRWVAGDTVPSYTTWRALRELAGVEVEQWPR